MSKLATLLLVAVLAVSSLIMVSSAFAESSTPSVPEFTLKYADYSYDVPPKTTTSTDPYTNETITTTIPGRHVENKTIEATINNNIGASYYNFRYKGRYEDEWRYIPSVLVTLSATCFLMPIPFPIKLRLQITLWQLCLLISSKIFP